MGPSNGILRVTLGLSRVDSDANNTATPHLEGNFFLKVYPFPPRLGKCHQAGKTSLHITCYASTINKLSTKSFTTRKGL